MKQLLTVALVVFARCIYAQPEPGPFAIVDFFKVPQGKEAAYIKLEKEVWKPIHEARLKAGEISGWFIYQMDLAGSGNNYNYVSVTLVENLGKIDEVNYQKWFKNIFPKRPIEDIMKQTTEARVFVRSEICRMLTAAEKNDQKPFQLINIGYVKTFPGQSEAFEKIVTNQVQPVVSDLLAAGKISGWHTWEVWQPGGSNAEYDYVRVIGLPNYASLNQGPQLFPEAFKKRYPMIDFNVYQKSVDATREVVRSEIWSLVESVTGPSPSTASN